MNTIKLNTLGDKAIVRKAAENGGNAGGDTGGTGGNMEYISLEDVNFASTAVRTALIKMSYAFKYLYENDGSKNIIITAMYNKPENATVYAVAIDFSFKIGDKSMIFSVKEWLAQMAGLDTDTLPRITEEEFYNLA